VGIGKQYAGGKCDNRRAQVFGKQCAGGRRDNRGAGIGKKCTGGRSNNRREWVLASNVLVQDATIEEHSY
jgi:hypothetical protein